MMHTSIIDKIYIQNIDLHSVWLFPHHACDMSGVFLQVLGINGYEQLVNTSSLTLAKKILQLLGQRHNAVATSAMKKEILLIVSILIEKCFEPAFTYSLFLLNIPILRH